MNEELILLITTLKSKVSDGIKKISEIDIEDTKYGVILDNIMNSSNIVVNIETRVAQQMAASTAKENKKDKDKEEK